MELYFLSVGYGESIVLLEKEHCIVIDGGPGVDDTIYKNKGVISTVDFLKQKNVKKIDYMIATHLHNDHISGLLAVAQNFPVENFICNCFYTADPTEMIKNIQPVVKDDLSIKLFLTGLQHWQQLTTLLKQQNTKIIEKAETECFESLWDKCKIQFFGMSQVQLQQRKNEFEKLCQINELELQLEFMRNFDKNENSCSLACCIELNGWSAMLTSDLCTGWDLRCSKKNFPQAQLLKLTHHGQKDGMPQSLVDACDPYVFVICTDSARTFSSACDEVQLRAKNYLIQKNRIQQIYITGLLDHTFSDKLNRTPCGFYCNEKYKEYCIPYYN